MTFSQIEVFIEAVKLKNFTRVGEKLGLTQPAVSHAISGLEKDLGVKLFVRDRGGLQLTHHGQVAYEECLAIQAHAQRLYEKVAPARKLVEGHLRVGTLNSVSVSFLPKIIRRFNQTYPQIEISLFEGKDEELIQWIESGTLDFAFTTLPAGSLASDFVVQDEMMVVLPVGHPLAKAKALTLQQIRHEPFVMSAGGCQPLIEGMFADQGLVPMVKYCVGNISTVLGMIKERIGISLIPKLALKHASKEDHVLVPLKDRRYRRIGISYREENLDRDVLEVFLDMSRSVVKGFGN